MVLLQFFFSVGPNDGMSVRLVGCYLFYSLHIMILKPFTFCCFCKGLLGIVLYYFDILCILCQQMCFSMCDSVITHSFHFTCQCTCLYVINAEGFSGSYSATHSSFYRPFLRNNKISQDSFYLF